MSTNINANVLKNFIVDTLGYKVTERNAGKYGIDSDDFQEANTDENNYLELDEILDDKDLYEKFATMFVEEKEQEQSVKDEETEKEEQMSIKDKNGAGV